MNAQYSPWLRKFNAINERDFLLQHSYQSKNQEQQRRGFWKVNARKLGYCNNRLCQNSYWVKWMNFTKSRTIANVFRSFQWSNSWEHLCAAILFYFALICSIFFLVRTVLYLSIWSQSNLSHLKVSALNKAMLIK